MSQTLRAGHHPMGAHDAGGGRRHPGVDELQRAIQALDAGEFRRRPSLRVSPTKTLIHHSPSQAWTPGPAELVVPVLGCAGQDGATTLALAIAGAAAVPARVVECAAAPLSGLAVASDAELGPVGDAWQRGRRGSVLLERRTQMSGHRSEPPLPSPAAEGPTVTILDAGALWPAVHAHGWVAQLLAGAPRLVLVSRLSIPGVRRLEAALALLGEDRVIGAVVGQPYRRWPRSVACTLGPLTRSLIRAGRLVSVREDRRLALFGLTSTDLPRPVAAAGQDLLTLMEGPA